MGLFERLGRRVGEFERQAREAKAEMSGGSCPDCGAEIEDDREVCPDCGAAVGTDEERTDA